MERRARSTVFWPGMTHDIYNVCYNCAYCDRNAPYHAATPPITPDPPSRLLPSSTFLLTTLTMKADTFWSLGTNFLGELMYLVHPPGLESLVQLL